MKKIFIYNNGSLVINDPESNTQATINGQKPETIVDATEDNIKKHFGKTHPHGKPVIQ